MTIPRTETSKPCSKCKEWKPFNEFHNDKNRKDGMSYWCKTCSNAHTRIKEKSYKERRKELWHSKPKDDPSKLKKYANNRKNRRQWQYGISPEDLANLMVKQKESCAICGISFKSFPSKKIHLDHCHNSQKIRGLLCNKCNALIGFANDNISILNKAVNYLSNNQ